MATSRATAERLNWKIQAIISKTKRTSEERSLPRKVRRRKRAPLASSSSIFCRFMSAALREHEKTDKQARDGR